MKDSPFVLRYCPKCQKRTPMFYWGLGCGGAPSSVKCVECETEWVVDDDDYLTGAFIVQIKTLAQRLKEILKIKDISLTMRNAKLPFFSVLGV